MFLDDRESVEFEPWVGKPKTECMAMNINTVAANTISKRTVNSQYKHSLTTELKISEKSSICTTLPSFAYHSPELIYRMGQYNLC